MLEPPTSAIIARTPATLNNLRQRICPCNCCTCPPVYVKDVGIQTNPTMSSNQDDTLDMRNSPELGDLTQLAAETIGKFDGLTQQTIMETAKPKRTRPKSVVHFKEVAEERSDICSKSYAAVENTPLNDFKDTIPAGTGFKSGRGKPVMAKKPVDVSKLFGDIMEGFPANVLDNVSEIGKAFTTSKVININQGEGRAKLPATDKSDTIDKKKPFGEDFANLQDFSSHTDSGARKSTGSKIASGFTKSGSGAAITSTKKVDVKKLFGDDFETLKVPGFSTGDVQEMKANIKSSEVIGFQTSASIGKPCSGSGFAKAGSGTAIASSKKVDVKKLFGDDFDDLKVPSDVSKEAEAPESKQSESSTSTVKPASGFSKAGSGAAITCNKKIDAKQIFGDDFEDLKFPNKPEEVISEIETNKTSGFQPSTALPSIKSPEDDMSDVESIYDVDIDSSSLQGTTDDNEPMEDSIPAEMFLPTAEATPSYDSKLVEARALQRKIIADKNSSDSSERTFGVLYRSKLQSDKSNILELSSLCPKYRDVGCLDENIVKLVVDPHSSYRFPAVFCNEQLISRWDTIDGGLLVSAADGTVGCDEISTCLLTTPGVDPRLIPNGWIENHFRWIIWKLAKEVFVFSDQFPKPDMRLNAEIVLQQLKYRYDREINCCKRSCLRRIVEKDSSPKGLMVLCVSKIVKTPSTNEGNSTTISEQDDQHSKDSTSSNFHQQQQQIELTDGWYAVNASLDHHLQRMVNCGRIFVGCKLVVAGSELLGLNDGCDPLNIPPLCCLRLSSNSTRLVSKWWKVKMGFLAKSKLDVPISSLLPGGGFAHSIKVLVARVYPLLYVEKRVSPVTGMTESIYRLESEEAAEAERAKIQQEKKMEEVMQKMGEENCQSPVKPGGKRRKITQSEVKEISSGDEIAEALRESFDPESLMEMLSKEQKVMYEQYLNLRNDRMAKKMRQAMEKMKEDYPSVVRNVVPMLKIFVVGVHANDKQHNSTAVISIWRPVANYRDLLQEGQVYHFHNVTVSRPSSGANSAAMLNGTQHTSWEPMKTRTSFVDCYIERIDGLVKLVNMTQKEVVHCNREMDIAGVILKVNCESRRLFFIDIEGDVGVIVGNSVSFCSFLSAVERNGPVVFVALNLKTMPTGGLNISNTNLPSLLAQDFSFFSFLSPNTQSVPLRLANLCRHLEASVKSAIANRNSLSETGFSKLQAIIK